MHVSIWNRVGVYDWVSIASLNGAYIEALWAKSLTTNSMLRLKSCGKVLLERGCSYRKMVIVSKKRPHRVKLKLPKSDSLFKKCDPPTKLVMNSNSWRSTQGLPPTLMKMALRWKETLTEFHTRRRSGDITMVSMQQMYGEKRSLIYIVCCGSIKNLCRGEMGTKSPC